MDEYEHLRESADASASVADPEDETPAALDILREMVADRHGVASLAATVADAPAQPYYRGSAAAYSLVLSLIDALAAGGRSETPPTIPFADAEPITVDARGEPIGGVSQPAEYPVTLTGTGRIETVTLPPVYGFCDYCGGSGHPESDHDE